MNLNVRSVENKVCAFLRVYCRCCCCCCFCGLVHHSNACDIYICYLFAAFFVDYLSWFIVFLLVQKRTKDSNSNRNCQKRALALHSAHCHHSPASRHDKLNNANK